ncbi:MAG: thymidine phosphorylase [Planctomycetes bacterium]|nr:thymidine phosphorylase [Planctomycetota bacterium]
MIERWLSERREGQEQSPEDIRGFVEGVVEGTVSRPQAAAWLAFVTQRGMTRAETVALTQAMTESGRILSWPGIEGPFFDKHSTGGIGDKVSLVLAPVWAAMGKKVPMLSGRGLGITGGTLDKLEAIPGYNTQLTPEHMHEQLASVGCIISGQTEEIAPADRILYALRDETGTVPSIPLITASILSKKLVEGLDRLVLDVKWGSGAFMSTLEDAQELAESLVEVGRGAGLDTEAFLEDMNHPLGCAIGNAVEVQEAVECLEGRGPAALRALVLRLSGAPELAAEALDSGAAHRFWQNMVVTQGGDPEAALHGQGVTRLDVHAEASGCVVQLDAGCLGRAAYALGAGRSRAGDSIHHGVGLLLRTELGAEIRTGDPWVTVLHADGAGLELCLGEIRNGMVLD